MAVVFTVSKVAIDDLTDLNAVVAGLAENTDELEGRYLIIGRSNSVDEQDSALGLDTYHIENERGSSCSGGIVSHAFEPGLLRLHLTSEAADVLELPVEAEFPLKLSRDEQRIVLISGEAADRSRR